VVLGPRGDAGTRKPAVPEQRRAVWYCWPDYYAGTVVGGGGGDLVVVGAGALVGRTVGGAVGNGRGTVVVAGGRGAVVVGTGGCG